MESWTDREQMKLMKTEWKREKMEGVTAYQMGNHLDQLTFYSERMDGCIYIQISLLPVGDIKHKKKFKIIIKIWYFCLTWQKVFLHSFY